jgi:hypothetical protein
MSAAVKAAHDVLRKAIVAAVDDARKCRITPGDNCPHCDAAIEFAMKQADLYAYAALEADQPAAKP